MSHIPPWAQSGEEGVEERTDNFTVVSLAPSLLKKLRHRCSGEEVLRGARGVSGVGRGSPEGREGHGCGQRGRRGGKFENNSTSLWYDIRVGCPCQLTPKMTSEFPCGSTGLEFSFFISHPFGFVCLFAEPINAPLGVL